MFHNSQLKLFFEQGKELLPNASAQPLRVAIGCVFTPVLLLAPKISSQFGAADVQKRPKNGASHRVNPAKPGDAGSAKNMREHSFALVVCRVSHGNARTYTRID